MKIKLYAKENCIWCERAKALLAQYDLKYLEIDLTDDTTREQFYKEVGHNVATVPQIYFDDKRIGGYNELLEWLSNNDKK